MDYYCQKCRETHYGNTLKGRRCVSCRGPLHRLKGGVPLKKMASLTELVK